MNLGLPSINIVLSAIQYRLQLHGDVIQLNAHALFEVSSEFVQRVDIGVELCDECLFLPVPTVCDAFTFPCIGVFLLLSCMGLDLACKYKKVLAITEVISVSKQISLKNAIQYLPETTLSKYCKKALVTNCSRWR